MEYGKFVFRRAFPVRSRRVSPISAIARFPLNRVKNNKITCLVTLLTLSLVLHFFLRALLMSAMLIAELLTTLLGACHTP
jgi:hypothetical protein